MIEHLPWDPLKGPKYYPVDLKLRKKWVTVGSWFMSGLLILGGLTTKNRVAAIFGLLYILTLLMVKSVAVTSRGLEIFYQMRITTHHDFRAGTTFARSPVRTKAIPNWWRSTFANDIKSKRLFFTSDAERS